MLQRLVVSAALACALFATTGLAQTPPSQCVQTHMIINEDDIYIVPGVVNCFVCNLQGTIAWRVEEDRDLVPPAQSPNAEADGNFLIIASPDTYIEPGTRGRRDIICTSLTNGANYEVRLASPILAQPQFLDATVSVNETELLKITCLIRNIPEISMFEVLDPNGVPVDSVLGVYTVDNVLRNASGVYTCVVRSTLDGSNVTATSTVIIQFAPEVTAVNDTAVTHRIILGQELRLGCSYMGVPEPDVVWLRNGEMLMNGVGGVTILGGAPGDNEITLVISTVERTSMGTYTCRANNTVGMDEEQYSVIILVPPERVTNLVASNIAEHSVRLSWMTGADGFTPITRIEITITPERGPSPTPNPMIIDPPMNLTMVSNLLPFRRYEFTVVVRNLAGLSESVSINASTLSLTLPVPQNPMLVAVNSTSLRLTWDPPMFDNDTTDDPNFYLVDFSLLNTSNHIASNIPATPPPLMAEFNQLLKGTLYIARIVPVNDAGNGTATNFLETQTNVDPPSMPQDLTATGVGATAIRVTWAAPADNGGRSISNYRIIVDAIGYNETVGADITSRLIRDNGLVQSTTYMVRVSAANAEQGFGNAASDMATTQSILEPQTIFDEPLSDSDESSNNSAVLNWVFPGGTVDFYIVQYVLARDPMGFESNAVVTVVVNGNETSTTVGGELLPGATYNFRVAVNNSLGMSAFSIQGRFETAEPDPAIITVSEENPVDEGTNIQLNCSATLRGSITYSWTKDDADLPSDSMFQVNPTLGYLRITMATEDSAGSYVCMARNAEGTMTTSVPYVLQIQQVEPTGAPGIDQNVIIIVASVGGAALLVFVIVVIIAIACLCNMKAKSSKSSYAMKPMKSKDRP